MFARPVSVLLEVAVLVLVCSALALPVPGPDPAKLLRVPKVYNALITSDEPLLPSRTEQATVGQVLYYPRHDGYPASSGPLVLPPVQVHQVQQQQLLQQVQLQGQQDQQVYEPQNAEYPNSQGYDAVQQLVSQQNSVPQDSRRALPQHYELPSPQEMASATSVQESPVVYASDSAASAALRERESPVVYASDVAAAPAPAPAPAPQVLQASRAADLPQDASRLTYQPPPSVHIDSIKNNRPAGIRDVPPPPLPAGRRATARPQAIPPGIIPF